MEEPVRRPPQAQGPAGTSSGDTPAESEAGRAALPGLRAALVRPAARVQDVRTALHARPAGGRGDAPAPPPPRRARDQHAPIGGGPGGATASRWRAHPAHPTERPGGSAAQARRRDRHDGGRAWWRAIATSRRARLPLGGQQRAPLPAAWLCDRRAAPARLPSAAAGRRLGLGRAPARRHTAARAVRRLTHLGLRRPPEAGRRAAAARRGPVRAASPAPPAPTTCRAPCRAPRRAPWLPWPRSGLVLVRAREAARPLRAGRTC